ncbi:uncharacterized protein LOC144649765 [Oculina patagonica]
MFSGPITVLLLVVFVSPVQAWHFPDFRSYDNGNYNMSWKINRTSDRLYFKVEVKATGWVEFGLAKNVTTNMTVYDVAVGGVNNGTCYLKDYLTVGQMKPQLDLKQDWILIDCSEVNSVTKLEFYRARDTSDNNDTVVEEGNSMSIVWAYNDTTDVLANMTIPRQTARGYDNKTVLWPDALATTAITPTVKTNATNSSVSTTQSTTPPGPPPTTEPRTEPRTEPTVKPSTSPSEKTCAELGVKVNTTWDEKYKNKSSNEYKQATKAFSVALTLLYTGKHDHVLVSEVTFTEKDKLLFAKGKLCLVFNDDDDDFIEDVFKEKVETGKLSENFTVIKCSSEFEAVGVSFNWEAKKGECTKKCEGAGGPFDIVGTCKVKTEGLSCKGLKTTKKSDDCPEYCHSSSVAITFPSLILAIGILLSFSFQ